MSGTRIESTSSWRWMFRALASANYRLFFGGQLISLCGTWLSSVATSWLIYRLALPGNAARLLGLVSFAAQGPMLLAPFFGIWVDRFPRRQILLGTQTASMIQSFALACLVFTGHAQIGSIFALALIQGLINAIDMPARQAFVPELVDSRHLGNAIALNSSMVHSARLLGPALAGWLIYQVGEGWCFTIDGVSYLGVLIALRRIHVSEQSSAPSPREQSSALFSGYLYAWRFRPIRVLLITVALMSLAASSQAVLMPILAGNVLRGNEQTLGMLLGASGLGALLGSLYLASRRSVTGLGRVIVMASVTMGVGLLALATSRSLWISLLILIGIGASLVIQMAACNTLLQTIVDDHQRGRVMSIFSVAFMGMAPFGALLAGGAATYFAAPNTLFGSAVLALTAALVFAYHLPEMRRLVRPIYIRKGILPGTATELETLPEVTSSPTH